MNIMRKLLGHLLKEETNIKDKQYLFTGIAFTSTLSVLLFPIFPTLKVKY